MLNIAETLTNPAATRAIVIGLFGGAGLALATIYSRRGPLIYPVYASILAALALLLSRFAGLSFADRFAAALLGFIVASVILTITVARLARLNRERLVKSGRLSPSAIRVHCSMLGYAWRLAFLLVVGSVVSAG